MHCTPARSRAQNDTTRGPRGRSGHGATTLKVTALVVTGLALAPAAGAVSSAFADASQPTVQSAHPSWADVVASGDVTAPPIESGSVAARPEPNRPDAAGYLPALPQTGSSRFAGVWIGAGALLVTSGSLLGAALVRRPSEAEAAAR